MKKVVLFSFLMLLLISCANSKKTSNIRNSSDNLNSTKVKVSNSFKGVTKGQEKSLVKFDTLPQIDSDKNQQQVAPVYKPRLYE